ncbi:hypothetical protein [Methylobacter sp.]|uniref:hypothetical protein n=1 Tax=Methylobacter sp. TaxID=2051955 RepID=UPI002FDE2734
MMIFCPRNTRKAQKHPYSRQDSIDTKMTLALECRLRLLWQAKLAIPSLPASQVDRNKTIQARSARWRFRQTQMLAGNANSRCRLNQLIPAYFAKNADLVKILGTTFLIFFVPFVDKIRF